MPDGWRRWTESDKVEIGRMDGGLHPADDLQHQPDERGKQDAEVSPFGLRHEIHNRGDQRISRGVAGNAAIDTETLAAEVLGECPS